MGSKQLFAVAYLLVMAVGCVLPGLLLAGDEGDTKADVYREALITRLAPQAQAALARIEGEQRQLLAIRSYLRAGPRLAQQWSWSQKQIKAFAKTPEYQQLIAAVEQVRARFEADNPGFTLYANTEVRSLDAQIERWNTNNSVAHVAGSIQRAVSQELLRSNYPDQPDDKALDQLEHFVRQWVPHRAAALAAPGLSKHGQLRAIDFAILKDHRIVAPTNLAAADKVWDRKGWSAKLKQATLGTPFVGPLRRPDEPWHYEYDASARGVHVAGK
jgi:hypothetical protein